MSGSRKQPEPIEVVWEAPPERTVQSIYRHALAEIKKTPGRWARVRKTSASGGAYSTRKTIRAAVEGDDRWEVVVSRIDIDDEAAGWGVWARYRNDEQMAAAKR